MYWERIHIFKYKSYILILKSMAMKPVTDTFDKNMKRSPAIKYDQADLNIDC
jgi:hypothetical protein